MSEFGFDEGSLFDTLSKPKHTIEKFTYNDDGTVKKKTTTVTSYWDLVMAVGGPALLFMIWNIVQRIGSTVPDWFSDEEVRLVKEHPLAFLALGPLGFKIGYNRAKAANRVAEWSTTIGKGWIEQIVQNYGLKV